MTKTIRHTFKKFEKLTSNKAIQKLMKEGKQFRAFPFFVRYLLVENSDAPAKILFSVPKKKFKNAVDRNRIKRLCREAYRLNKPKFYSCLENKNIQINIAITYFDYKIPDFKTVNKKIIEILDNICAELDNFSQK